MKTIINSIESKVVKLIKQLKQLQNDKSDLQRINDNLCAKLEEKEKEILALHDKVKLMNISKSVDKDKDDIKATRLKINEYVREIDKCIALLNN